MAGRTSHKGFEEPGEVVWIVNSYIGRDLAHIQIAVLEILAGFCNAQAVDVLHRRKACHVFKKLPKMVGAQVFVPGKVVEVDGFRKIFFYIGQCPHDDRLVLLWLGVVVFELLVRAFSIDDQNHF